MFEQMHRSFFAALLCALCVLASSSSPILADVDTSVADVAAIQPVATDTSTVTPGDSASAAPSTPAPSAPAASATVTVAAPRPPSQFGYGTHLAAFDHAALAHQDGFGLMWGYVPWQQIEPSRGDFLFRHQDRWGRPRPNALTNAVNAAASTPSAATPPSASRRRRPHGPALTM